jgi:hypothetical protein
MEENPDYIQDDSEFNLNIDEEYKLFLSMLAGQIKFNLECDNIKHDSSLFYKY